MRYFLLLLPHLARRPLPSPSADRIIQDLSVFSPWFSPFGCGVCHLNPYDSPAEWMLTLFRC